MNIDVNGLGVHLIGDPHLGKTFEVGVPLHRRGQREASQFQHFEDELDVEADAIVMVGDLFDHPYVGDAVAIRTGDLALAAARARPWVNFYYLAGNHDMPRNLSKKGAFDSFEKHVDGREPNLFVIKKPVVLQGMAFYPWEWGVKAKEQIRKDENAYAAIGHWDLKAFEGKDDHLCPCYPLYDAHGYDIELYSGHYHTPGDYEVDGCVVHCTGSMEPYSHGEDPSGEVYTTLTRAEALSALPEALSGKCVRVILAPGEDLPDIDCLALTHIRTKVEVDASKPVSLDTFDWKGILAAKLAPLHPVVRDFIKDLLPDATEELS